MLQVLSEEGDRQQLLRAKLKLVKHLLPLINHRVDYMPCLS